MSTNTAPPKKVGMISLGCAKNLVDAEIMLGGVLKRGMQITGNADEADVLIVNTCAFIDSAKEESIEAILEAHESRGLKRRAGQRLIVSGCMAQRFAKELKERDARGRRLHRPRSDRRCRGHHRAGLRASRRACPLAEGESSRCAHR
ncbi:MAG: hypothetical protein WDN28_25800 [Chthoniobacter sp.]